jgi:RNA polymerase sigma-70 factor (ECF subfamily)
MEDEKSGDLLARWRTGDQEAAAVLFQRYTNRLIALARSRLPVDLARRVDAEDVVQSVYRSFFAGAHDGHYQLQQGGDLWRLLVTITLHKVYYQVKRNQADKRAVRREQPLAMEDTLHGIPAQRLAQDPSPMELLALVDELERMMRGLDPVERRMLQMRLQGHNLAEIAADTQRCQQTVRRLLKRVQRQWEQCQTDNSAT